MRQYCTVRFRNNTKKYVYYCDCSKLLAHYCGAEIIVEANGKPVGAVLYSKISMEQAFEKLGQRKMKEILAIYDDTEELFYSSINDCYYDDLFDAQSDLQSYIDNKTDWPTNENKETKGTKNMKKKSIIESMKDTGKETKDIALKVQIGMAVTTSIKTALLTAPILPDQLKELLNKEPYASLMIGLVMKTAIDTIGIENKTVKSAVDAAYFTSSIALSSQFTQIQKLIESSILKAVGHISVDADEKEAK